MQPCALTLTVDVALGANCHFHRLKVNPRMRVCSHSVKQKSGEGLEATRMELEEREKVREELQGTRVWLEAADGLLLEMEQSGSTKELQVGCSTKPSVTVFIRILKEKFHRNSTAEFSCPQHWLVSTHHKYTQNFLYFVLQENTRIQEMLNLSYFLCKMNILLHLGDFLWPMTWKTVVTLFC